MSEQYEQAVLERNSYGSSNSSWIFLAVIFVLALIIIFLSLSKLETNSNQNALIIEFQKTLFEQTNGLNDLTAYLSNNDEKNKHYFTRIKKYSNEIYHRFIIISEFIVDNGLLVDQKKFSRAEKNYRKPLDAILEQREKLIQFYKALGKVQQTLPRLLALNSEVTELLIQDNTSENHTYFITRQLFLIERVSNSVQILMDNVTGSAKVIAAADRIGRDMALIMRVYKGLLDGDYRMNVAKIKNLKVRAQLQKIAKTNVPLSKEIGIVLQLGIEVFQFSDRRFELEQQSKKLQKNYQTLFFDPNDTQEG